MRLVSAIAAAGILAAAATAAYADTVTQRVIEWNPAKKTVTFADRSQMVIEPELVPQELQAGDEITVDYLATEDGVQKVLSVTVKKSADQPAKVQ